MSFELNAVCNSGEGCQWKHTFWTSKERRNVEVLMSIDDRFMLCVELVMGMWA